VPTSRGPDNSARVAVGGTFNGINWANVFRAQLSVSAPPTQADFDAWVAAVGAAYKAQFAARQITDVLYRSAVGVFYAPGGGELASVAALTGNGANAVGTGYDQEACKVISWLSTVFWRGGKPRSYLPGVQPSDIATGHLLSSGEIAALLAAAGGFRTAINGITSGAITATQFGFVSFRTGNADRVPPVFFPITGARVHGRLGTQRRRLGKWVT
jgi:hypothetical protein